MEENAIVPRRILVVDDEPYVCDALRLMLSLDGHDVVTATAGDEALELFRGSQFDLLITDYCMSGMKGDQLAAAVKTLNPDLPVIMVTAYIEKFTAERSGVAFVDELIGKPFRLEQIKAAMARVLDGAAMT